MYVKVRVIETRFPFADFNQRQVTISQAPLVPATAWYSRETGPFSLT